MHPPNEHWCGPLTTSLFFCSFFFCSFFCSFVLSPAHCLPGEYLNARAGECRLVTNASETQLFECTTGMRFYRCPLGEISCPGSSKICYETNKPPLVCAKDTTLANCLQCCAAESAELAAANKAAEAKYEAEAVAKSHTQDLTDGLRRRLQFGRRLVNDSGTTNGTSLLSDNEVSYAYAANGNTNAM